MLQDRKVPKGKKAVVRPTKALQVTMKWHKTKANDKMVAYSAITTVYLSCPHCKKIILVGPKEEVETLKKWKKQK